MNTSSNLDIDRELLDNRKDEIEHEDLFREVRGSYSPQRYAVLLNKKIHNILMDASIPDTDFRKAEAFSTYLHETIHWWQHIGSYSGFVCSLFSPAIAHLTSGDIKSLWADGMLQKSIIALARNMPLDSDDRINRILNNSMDFSFAYKFIMDPQNCQKIFKDAYYTSVGHFMYMMWSSVSRILKSTFEEETPFFVDSDKWYTAFAKARVEKNPRSYFGNDILLPPFGMKAIFEAQARISQLQYVEIGSGLALGYEDFHKQGQFNGVYGEALKFYIDLFELTDIQSMLAPEINLFLLICDVALNPTEGFPNPVSDMDSWVLTTAPGNRFAILCSKIKTDYMYLLTRITKCSDDDYREVSRILHGMLDCFDSIQSMEFVANSGFASSVMQQLLNEESSSKFSPKNMPVRLLTAKFIRFQQDKVKHPSFFCWLGIHMTSLFETDGGDASLSLFNKHKALFSGNEHDQIRATIFDHLDLESWHTAYEEFYTWLSIYDMTLQLIFDDGPFEYDYDWLAENPKQDDIVKWADDHFQLVYGFKPQEVI